MHKEMPLNPIRKKIEDNKMYLYFVASEYSGKIDYILVNEKGKAITVWMDEEPIINNDKYLLKYQDLHGNADGIAKTNAQYLMLVMGAGTKMNLHFFPTKAISKGIMFENWKDIESKKLDGKFFEVPIEWLKSLEGIKKI